MRKNSIKNTRVNGAVLKELSTIIHSEIKDPRIHPMTSVTAVEVAPDLKTCKAYISVLGEKQAKDFKAAMKEMRPAKNKSNERPTREEMQKKRQEIDAKIKSILTDEQYKKYQDMRKKDNAKKKKKAK